MAPTRSLNPDLPRKTLAKRKAEADEEYFLRRQEYRFIAALSAFGDDILGTPIEPVAAAVPVASSAEYDPMEFEFSDSEDSEDEVEYVGSAPSHKWKWGQEVVVIPNNGWVEVVEIN